jgi:hypothetical protein
MRLPGGNLVLLALLACGCATGHADPRTGAGAEQVVRAGEAFQQHRFRDARVVADSAVANPALLPADRVTAEHLLARLAWRIDGDFERGREHYRRALRVGLRQATAWAGLSRLEAAAGRTAESRQAALRGVAAARELDDSVLAAAQLGAAAADPALEEALARRPPAAADTAALRAALGVLKPAVAAYPGLLEVARPQLTAALLLDDGPDALAAWRSYYLTAVEQPGSRVKDAERVLARVLPGWRGGAASPAERLTLFRALADSRLYDEAELEGMRPGAGIDTLAEVRTVAAYARFCRRVRHLSDEYYRRTALGQRDHRAFTDTLDAEAARLWEVLRPPGDTTGYRYATFRAELARRFGAYYGLGVTAGYYDVHFGHAVVEREEGVEQYGQRARLRLVSLDQMVSNGFQSWAWDGEAAHGGWADTATIYEVRPARAGLALKAWARWVEHRAGGIRGDRLAEDSAADWARAARGPVVFLPGLNARLQRDGVVQILGPLRVRGLAGQVLQRAFEVTYDSVMTRGGIFGHEGRHSIDRRLHQPFTSADLEYRAKLSEIAFSPVPRLALAAIVQPNAGDATPHGQANARALRGLYAWMQAHAGEIRGLDPSLPLLPQATKLSDEQIRAAFRSLDPLAAPHPAAARRPLSQTAGWERQLASHAAVLPRSRLAMKRATYPRSRPSQ